MSVDQLMKKLNPVKIFFNREIKIIFNNK